MRRAFRLPEDDERFLERLGLPWETISEGGANWLLIDNYPVPPGYTASRARVALRIEPCYPDTQLDMVYFAPALARSDGGALGGLAGQALEGTTYQRWSRHRTAENPWRPGIDGVETHMLLVDNWLAAGLMGRAA